MLRLASLTSLFALVGCVDTGDEGMIVLNNTAVQASCTLTGSKSQPFIAHGTITAESPSGYLLTPLIESRVTLATGSTDMAARTIFMTGANVSLSVVATTLDQGGAITSPPVSLSGMQAQFRSLFSGSLPPAGTVNVGFEIIPVAALRTILTASGAGPTDNFSAEVLATVTILGKLGNDEIESLPFQYPVSVCTNCILRNVGMCTGAEPTAGNPCNPYQDGYVDCCVDATDNLICPGA